MKTILTTLGYVAKAFLICAMGAPANASADVRKYSIDMGSVTLKLVDANASEQITYQIPRACLGATLQVRTSGNETTLSHTGRKCPQGAQIEIPIKPNFDTSIMLVAGVLQAEDPVHVLKAVNEVDLSVDSGVIKSHIVPITHTDSYAGAKGKLTNPEAASGRLKLTVRAGVVAF